MTEHLKVELPRKKTERTEHIPFKYWAEYWSVSACEELPEEGKTVPEEWKVLVPELHRAEDSAFLSPTILEKPQDSRNRVFRKVLHHMWARISHGLSSALIPPSKWQSKTQLHEKGRISLILGEMQLKTTMSYHLTSVRMAIIKTWTSRQSFI